MGSISMISPCDGCGRCAWPTGQLWEMDHGGDGALYCDVCWQGLQKAEAAPWIRLGLGTTVPDTAIDRLLDFLVGNERSPYLLLQRRKAGWRYLLLGPPPLMVQQPSTFRKLVGVAKGKDIYTDLLDWVVHFSYRTSSA